MLKDLFLKKLHFIYDPHRSRKCWWLSIMGWSEEEVHEMIRSLIEASGECGVQVQMVTPGLDVEAVMRRGQEAQNQKQGDEKSNGQGEGEEVLQ